MLFSEYVKNLRESDHLSIRQFAREYGLSHVQIIKIENGEMDSPTLLVAERMCRSFDLDTDRFCSMIRNGNDHFCDQLMLQMTDHDVEDSCIRDLKAFARKYTDNILMIDDGKTGNHISMHTIGEPVFRSNRDQNDLSYNAVIDLSMQGHHQDQAAIKKAALYYLPVRRRKRKDSDSDFCHDFICRFLEIIDERYAGPDISLFITPSKTLFDTIRKTYHPDIIDRRHQKEIYLIYSEYNTAIHDQAYCIMNVPD